MNSKSINASPVSARRVIIFCIMTFCAVATWQVFSSSSQTNLIEGRDSHFAFPLKDGNVLVLGGVSHCRESLLSYLIRRYIYRDLNPDRLILEMKGNPDSELYVSRTGTWQRFGAGIPIQNTGLGDAVFLKNGKILLVDLLKGPCQLYDPKTNVLKSTSQLINPHENGMVISLKNGHVLAMSSLAFTYYSQTFGKTCELYDPDTQVWTPTTNCILAHHYTNARISIQNGDVLVTSGPFAEVFNAASKTWKQTGALVQTRPGVSVTLLQDGEVLLAGGVCSKTPTVTFLRSCELYDPVTNQWHYTGDMNHFREFVQHTQLLPNGQVLVLGGQSGPVKSCELYDPKSGKWTDTGSLNVSRVNYSMTLLENGKVLVAGGLGDDHLDLSSCELYDVASGKWTLQ